MCGLDLSDDALHLSEPLQTDINLSDNTQHSLDSTSTDILYDSNYTVSSSKAQTSYESDIKYSNANACSETQMDEFLHNFATKVNRITNNEKQKDDFFNWCGDLIGKYSAFVKSLNQANSTAFNAIDFAQNFVTQKLRQSNTAEKRQRQIETASSYVKPQEFALGTRWEMKRTKDGPTLPQLVESTYQYIPIIDTLRALFENQHFRKMYLEYNKKVTSNTGVYEDFRCGSVFKNNALYQKYPNSLQIKIMTDDFTVANPLGPRSSTHKLCGMYFLVENLPKEYLSRVENIFVISLSHSNDLKTQFAVQPYEKEGGDSVCSKNVCSRGK